MSGDKAASALTKELTQAYSERGPRLRTIASRAGFEDAADVVHDAFLKTVETSHRAEVKAPVHLLFRIARTVVIDRLRSRGRTAALFRQDGLEIDLPDESSNPERILLASDRLRCALAVIERMPPKRREVFLLHRLEGHSYAQIAKRVGISVKTVEKHMATAMAQLSREVDGAGL